jgi:hypothetical protein
VIKERPAEATTTMERRGHGESDSPESGVIACAVLTVSFAAIFVALRFYTRWKIVKMIGGEDWFILVSLILSVGNSIAICYGES